MTVAFELTIYFLSIYTNELCFSKSTSLGFQLTKILLINNQIY